MKPPVLAALSLIATIFLALPAHAASVKNVQSGSVAMTSTTQTVPITTVDPTKAFVVCSERILKGQPDALATCELSANAVTITNSLADAGDIVQWYVVEFDGGVSVQRGLTTLASTDATINVPLAAVTLSKSFVLTSVRFNLANDNNDEQWTIRAQLTSSTNLELSRNQTGDPTTVAWQVVQMEGASVQRGLTTLSGVTSTTAPISPVDPTKSFLLFTRRADAAVNGTEPRYFARGELTNATTLTFTRLATNNFVEIALEVVSLDDGTSVQRGTASTASTSDPTLNAALTAVDLSRTVPVISVSGSTAANVKDLDSLSWTASFTATTNLQLNRGNAKVNSQVAWFAVQFFGCGTIANSIALTAATTTSTQTTLQWSATTPIVILRKTAAFTTEAPAQGQLYNAGDTVSGATVVHSGSGVQTSFTDTGLTAGTTYYYRAFSKTLVGATTACYASGVGNDVTGRPATSAKEQWSYMLAGGSALKAPAADANGDLYVATNANWVISLAPTTGLHTWVPKATSQPIQSYLVWAPQSSGATSLVYGGDQGGTVYAVETAGGTTTSPGWQTTLSGADAIQAGISIQVRAYSNSAFATAYPGTYDVAFAATSNTIGSFTTNNKVFALRSDTGAVLWTFNPCSPTCVNTVDQIVGQPWVDYARNYLYVTSRAGAGAQSSLWVLDSRNGAVVTSFALGHLSAAPTQSFDGATLWVGNANGDLYAINLLPATPTLKWTGPLALGASAALRGFVWEDWSTAGRLYFSTANGAVRCFQDPGSGGTPSPSAACSGWAATATAVAGATTGILLDKLYVGSWNGTAGRIVPIDPATGAAGTAYTVGDGAKQVGDVGTSDGTQIYVGTTEGKVFKISLPLP